MKRLKKSSLLLAILPVLAVPAFSVPSIALAQGVLEEVVVYAQRRAENVEKVPINVTQLSGERFTNIFEGGDDIRALAVRVPSLYAESSNGRLAPRFYIRGLGNSDFDLAASQPVSVIFDEVVQENVILKSFPLFDVERVEVLRGPQGTLFGRNTTAGIVKFDSRKPTQEMEGFFHLAYGEMDTVVAEGAIGAGLTDALSARLSVLYQDRSDWISNSVPAAADVNGLSGSDVMGGFEELGYRLQFLYEPSDTWSALVNLHGRENEGTASIFRANVLGAGTDDFNSNFDRDLVSFDTGMHNPQEANAFGGSLRLDIDFGDNGTFTSITALEDLDNRSLGDIDGGFGADPLLFPDPTAVVGPCLPGDTPGVNPCITVPSTTQDGIEDLDQFTQEFRFAVQATERTFWQAGFFYFDSDFTVSTNPFFIPATAVTHLNESWAMFGHVSHDINDSWTVIGGVRYTDDEKELIANQGFVTAPGVTVSDDEVSWDLSAVWAASDQWNFYGRIASGFRGPTIQGRDIAFFGAPSVANSETILSYEAGFKAGLGNGRARLNGSIYSYTVDDMQLSAIGGAGNTIMLINADEGTGFGVDIDGEFLITENFLVTGGFSYADTEYDDPNLGVAPCGSGMCTVLDSLLDPMDPTAGVAVDGNSFVQAPEYIFTFTADYRHPLGSSAELFFFTDWAWQGETQFFLYESAEFFSEDTFEGGIRLGYANLDGDWEVALFGRNITDEENVKGAIDFSNNTGFDNEPRVMGVSFTKNW